MRSCGQAVCSQAEGAERMSRATPWPGQAAAATATRNGQLQLAMGLLGAPFLDYVLGRSCARQKLQWPLANCEEPMYSQAHVWGIIVLFLLASGL